MIDKTFAHWLNCSFIMQMNSNYMGKVHTAGVAASQLEAKVTHHNNHNAAADFNMVIVSVDFLATKAKTCKEYLNKNANFY